MLFMGIVVIIGRRLEQVLVVTTQAALLMFIDLPALLQSDVSFMAWACSQTWENTRFQGRKSKYGRGYIIDGFLFASLHSLP